MFTEHVVNSTTEGGVHWISELLSKAISHHDNLLDPANVREWTDRDLDRLPADQQQEWRQAQLEELEALKKRNVYELTDLPPGRKTIKNRWTFDIKTDGRKKARLVAKGFSQIEGLDYDEIFSPVVRFETIRTILTLVALMNTARFYPRKMRFTPGSAAHATRDFSAPSATTSATEPQHSHRKHDQRYRNSCALAPYSPQHRK